MLNQLVNHFCPSVSRSYMAFACALAAIVLLTSINLDILRYTTASFFGILSCIFTFAGPAPLTPDQMIQSLGKKPSSLLTKEIQLDPIPAE